MVVLPAPLGPIKEKISPSRISNEQSSTARNPPKLIEISSSAKMTLSFNSYIP
jgi:hypothetical protein